MRGLALCALATAGCLDFDQFVGSGAATDGETLFDAAVDAAIDQSAALIDGSTIDFAPTNDLEMAPLDLLHVDRAPLDLVPTHDLVPPPFVAGHATPISCSADTAASADFDGDGVDDLAVLCGAVTLGDGAIESTVAPFKRVYPYDPQSGGGQAYVGQNDQMVVAGAGSLVAGELTGLSGADIAVATQGGPSSNVVEYSGDKFLFTPSSTSTSVMANGRSLAVGDFDSNGFNDLVLPSSNIASTKGLIILPKQDALLFGMPKNIAFTNFTSAKLVAVGALNNDALPDVAVASPSGSFGTLLNQGSFAFAEAAHASLGGGEPSALIIADVDGDQQSDVIAATNGGAIRVLLLKSDGSEKQVNELDLGTTITCLAVGDFTGDGSADLAVGEQNPGGITLLTNDGSGDFSISAQLPLAGSVRFVEVLNLDGQGKLDLVAITSTGNNGAQIIPLLNTQ